MSEGFHVVAVPVASMPPPPPAIVTPPPLEAPAISSPAPLIRAEVEPVRAWTHRPGDGPRADGTLPGAQRDEPRFGRAWIDASIARRQVLESDPFYRLAREIAGRTGRRIEDMLDMKNITDHTLAEARTTQQQQENATLESIDAFGWFSLSDAIDDWARGDDALREDLHKALLAVTTAIDGVDPRAKQLLRSELYQHVRDATFPLPGASDLVSTFTWPAVDGGDPADPEWEATRRALVALRRQERAAWHETLTTPIRLASSATIARLQRHAQLIGELDFILDGDVAGYVALRKALPAALARPSRDTGRLRELLDQWVERERARLAEEGRAAAAGPPALRWIPLPAQLGVLFLREQLQAALTAALSTILHKLGHGERLWSADASQRDIAAELIDEPQVSSDFFELVAANVRLADVLYPTRNQTNRFVIGHARTALVVLAARFERLGRDAAGRLALLSAARPSLALPVAKRPRTETEHERRYAALSGVQRRDYDTARELASL